MRNVYKNSDSLATDSTTSLDSRVRGKLSVTNSRISWLTTLDIDRTPQCTRKTSIICTIGPSTNSVEAIIALRDSGMNIVRMNFSHGTHEYHQSIIDNVRSSCKIKPGRPIAIALDTKGPEIRLGDLVGGEVFLPKGHEFILTTNEEWKAKGNLERIYIDYKEIGNTLEPGKMVFVDDGNLQLEVIESLGDEGIRVKTLNPHKLVNRKGVNLPFSKVTLPALSVKDKDDIKFGVKNDVDMIFASFIRKPEDIREIRDFLGPEVAKHMLIIAKIENHEGVKNFDAILAEADGIMVARGDLGIEIPPQKVFIAQKMIIARSNLAGKPVICATQMLESMTHHPRPTRAEASDVANAVYDGADCVMLSAETASGAYPCEAVNTMANICVEAESTIAYLPLFEELRSQMSSTNDVTETVACSAVNAALETYIHGIIVLTTTGSTARELAKFRPQVPIITVTREMRTARQIHLHRGCYALVYPDGVISDDWQEDVDLRFNWAIEESKKMGLLKSGGHVVLIQGAQAGHGHTNTMRILPVL